MNKVYRLVWNAIQKTWVVVSEFASSKGKGKIGTRRTMRASGMLGAMSMVMLAAEPADAWIIESDKVTDGGVESQDLGITTNTAIGDGAIASAANGNATAIGAKSHAFGESSVAVGDSASAEQKFSMAIGSHAIAKARYSIALGVDSSATSTYGIAMGYLATSKYEGDMALGDHATAAGGSATAVGPYASASAQGSVALGIATASQVGAVAVGRQSNALGGSAVAIGENSLARNNRDISIGFAAGSGSTASGINTDNLVIGSMAGMNVNGSMNSTLGYSAGNNVKGSYNLALGALSGVDVQGNDNISLGRFANYGSSASQAVAIGMSSNAVWNGVALGARAQANNYNDVALGADSTSDIAVGTESVTIAGTDYLFAGRYPGSTVSIGAEGNERTLTNLAAGRISETSTDAINGSQLAATNQAIADTQTHYFSVNDNGTHAANYDNDGASGIGALAAGVRASASGNTTVAMGSDSLASGLSSVAIGAAADATGKRAVAVGSNTQAAGDQALSLGNNALSLADKAVAIGAGAQAAHAGSVALGAGSTTAEAIATSGITIAGTDYEFAGAAPTSTVSVGGVGTERTITNTAAGRISETSTDAINGSQLFATNSAVDGLGVSVEQLNGRVDDLDQIAVKYDLNADGTVNHGRITLGGDSYDNSTHSGGTTITNVANGVNDGDAVNMSQLNETNQNVADNILNITNLDGRVSNVEGDIALVTGDLSQLDGRVTNLYETGTKYFHANSTGSDSQAIGQESVAIGMGAIASHDGSVALGAGSVANGSTLSKEAYLTGGIATGEVNVGDRRITGLSAGAEDADAVNVAQLKAVTASSVADAVMYDNSDHSSLTLGGTTYNSVTKTGGTKITNVARGENDSDAINMAQLNETNLHIDNVDNRVSTIESNITTITNGGGIKYFHANSSKADSVASGTDAVAVGPNAQANGEGAIAMGHGSSASANGSVALGQGASDNGRGAESYTGKYSGADNVTVGSVSIGNAATGETRTLSNLADGKEATDAVNLRQLDGAVAESKAYSDNSVKAINDGVVNVDKRVTKVEGDVSNLQSGTDGMFQVNNTGGNPKPKANGANSVAGGAGAEAGGQNSTAIGSNAKAHGRNSVAIGANSVADRDDTVAVGSAGAERQITHVAAGAADTDAVNLSQLNKGLADSRARSDQQYNSLKRDLGKQDDTLSAGIAGALAMAGLPQPYSPGASMASVGMGAYRGQSALAVGVSRISDNGKWVSKLQGNTDTQGEIGLSVGVGYQW